MITSDGIKGIATFMSPDSIQATAKAAAEKATGDLFDKALKSASTDAKRAAAANPATTVRPDYKQKLEEALRSLLGPQNEPAKVAASPLAPVLTDPKPGTSRTIDLDKLPPETGAELKRLQTASEQFEAHFIKDWFGKMRETSMDSDKSATGGMAKDFMDQALAESAARGSANLGIGATIFAETGKRVVQEALARMHTTTDTTA